jgi:hypothetical protein
MGHDAERMVLLLWSTTINATVVAVNTKGHAKWRSWPVKALTNLGFTTVLCSQKVEFRFPTGNDERNRVKRVADTLNNFIVKGRGSCVVQIVRSEASRTRTERVNTPSWMQRKIPNSASCEACFKESACQLSIDYLPKPSRSRCLNAR